MGAIQTGTASYSVSINNAPPGATTGLGIDLGSVYKQPIAVVTAGTGISAGVVDLEGSIDGTNYYKIVSSVALAAPGVYPVTASIPARWVRARTSTNTVGGNITVTVGAGG